MDGYEKFLTYCTDPTFLFPVVVVVMVVALIGAKMHKPKARVAHRLTVKEQEPIEQNTSAGSAPQDLYNQEAIEEETPVEEASDNKEEDDTSTDEVEAVEEPDIPKHSDFFEWATGHVDDEDFQDRLNYYWQKNREDELKEERRKFEQEKETTEMEHLKEELKLRQQVLDMSEEALQNQEKEEEKQFHREQEYLKNEKIREEIEKTRLANEKEREEVAYQRKIRG